MVCFLPALWPLVFRDALCVSIPPVTPALCTSKPPFPLSVDSAGGAAQETLLFVSSERKEMIPQIESSGRQGAMHAREIGCLACYVETW